MLLPVPFYICCLAFFDKMWATALATEGFSATKSDTFRDIT